MSPPITLPIMAVILKLVHRSILVLNVQDIFPELVVAMGIMHRDGWGIRLGRLLEKMAYFCADYIGVHSPKNRLHVIGCGVRQDKVHLLPLWVDAGQIQPGSRRNSFSVEQGLEDKFVVMYAGTIGFAMGARTIPLAAGLLSDNKNIHFVIAGGGSKFDELKALVQQLSLDNVSLLPPMPRERLSEMLSSADVLLVLLRKESTENPNGYFRAVIPHKLLTNMASAKPVVMSANEDSDAAAIVQAANCGWVVAPEDPEALAKVILNIQQGIDDLEMLGKNGREFVNRYFDSAMQVKGLESLFASLLEGKSYQFPNPWGDQ
jgi:colanic acid biosynthesis glycosyl transferase WcaI